MSNKKKKIVTLNNNQHYLFQHFIKQFQNGVLKFSIGQMMHAQDIYNLLTYMGYLDNNGNQQQNYQLTYTLANMLSQSYAIGYASQKNLCEFLMIVSNIKGKYEKYFEKQVQGLPNDCHMMVKLPIVPIKIGIIDENGKWLCSEEQKKKIRDMFIGLNLTRISNNQCKHHQRQYSIQKPKQLIFHPKILRNSQLMAEKRLHRLKIGLKQSVQNRLILNGSLQQSHLQIEMNKSREKEMQQCSFKPRIKQKRIQNNSRCSLKQNYYINLNKSYENNNNINIQQKLILKGQYYMNRKQNQIKKRQNNKKTIELQQCTFKPNLHKKSISTHKSPYVRSQEKQIKRLTLGRNSRQFINHIKSRGYPKDINWQNYYQKEHKIKNQLKNQEINQTIKLPILNIEIKIKDKSQIINVYQGDSIDELTYIVASNHNIEKQLWGNIKKLIYLAIQQCSAIHLKNQCVYAN